MTLLLAAALLSLERICYIWISRAPDAFTAWCARLFGTRFGTPVEIVKRLFVVFKILQGAVFLWWCYVHGDGSLLPATFAIGPLAAGLTLIAAGQLLSSLVFYRLGDVGVFYGNRLGYTLQRCEAFPFGYLRHPQYTGAILSIWGFFLVMRFPQPDWYILPVLETVYYAISAKSER